MAFTIVGTIGATSGIGVSGAASTPAFGTGQSRTAGNLLVCWCNGLNAGTLPGTPAGWSILAQLGTGSTSGSTVSATVFVKIATGSDSAPTIAGATNVQWQTQLSEYAGNGTIVIADQTGTATTVNTSPIVANNAAADVAASELFLWAYSLRNTATAAAITATPTTNNGTTTNSTQNNATSVANHYHNGWGITGVNTVADQMSMAFTPTTNVNRVAMVVGSVRLLPPVTKLIETADADFGVGLWSSTAQTGTAPAAASDFVHGAHQRSTKYFNNGTSSVVASNTVADSGGRSSQWFYFNALPAATGTILTLTQTGGGTPTIRIRATTAGALQLWDSAAQRGSNGSSVVTGKWYRISWAWVISSTSVNQVRVFLGGVLDITVSNTTITTVTSTDYILGNGSGDSGLDMRTSDHYIDNNTNLLDPGEVWVTAKRPFANGTANGFTSQVGSGASGYGSGHAPQVNERALSTTNGWQFLGVGSPVTEEYSIEPANQGDIGIERFTIIDYMGWISAGSALSETGQIIVNGATSNVSLTSSITIFKAIAGSVVYPAGLTDIGLVTSSTVTTVSLYEAGIVFAYIPNNIVPMPPPQYAIKPVRTGPFIPPYQGFRRISPLVTTQAASSVSTTSATGNGTLVDIGDAAVTVMGFVWATHDLPTLADNVVNDAGTALGAFADTLNALPSGTPIFYAAYATNRVGTSYGLTQTFTTSSGGVTYISHMMAMGMS